MLQLLHFCTWSEFSPIISLSKSFDPILLSFPFGKLMASSNEDLEKENEDALKVSMVFKSNWDKWNESIECSEEPMSWSLLFRAAALWKRTFSFFSILVWIRASMAGAFPPVVFQLVVCLT